MNDKLKRLETANEFIKIISEHGRHFFKFQDYISYFCLDSMGRIRFVDKYTHKPVYVAYKGCWKGFSDSGTLHRLVECLADYIRGVESDFGKPLDHLGPWPESCCQGDLWEYGDDMQLVRERCKALFE